MCEKLNMKADYAEKQVWGTITNYLCTRFR